MFLLSKFFQDVTMKVIAFSQQGPRAICILSANGVIASVTLRQADSSGGTLTYEVMHSCSIYWQCISSSSFHLVLIVQWKGEFELPCFEKLDKPLSFQSSNQDRWLFHKNLAAVEEEAPAMFRVFLIAGPFWDTLSIWFIHAQWHWRNKREVGRDECFFSRPWWAGCRRWGRWASCSCESSAGIGIITSFESRCRLQTLLFWFEVLFLLWIRLWWAAFSPGTNTSRSQRSRSMITYQGLPQQLPSRSLPPRRSRASHQLPRPSGQIIGPHWHPIWGISRLT